MMKNRVKITIAALAIGVLAMCGNMTGYATESADVVSTQANADGSTDAGGSESYAYVVTYDLNRGTYGTHEGKYIGKYNNESLKLDLSAIKPERDGYNLTGWWYIDSNDKEQKLDIKTEEIHLNELFPNNTTPTLTAEWTQVVTVTVDGTNAGTVAAGNVYSVTPAASDKLTLDKWVVNNSTEAVPLGDNKSGSITVKAATAENHVINIDASTGFGITSKKPYANFVSYWSPQSGKYLIQVTNETGHPLKFSKGTLDNQGTSNPEFFEIITDLPENTNDGYFTVLKPSIKERVAGQNGDYVPYNGNNVKAYNLTLSASDVQRNIKISFESPTGVTYTNGSTFVITLKNDDTLSPQDFLNTANNTATRDGFTNYRWTYSVKDIDGKSTTAENISTDKWDESAGSILEKKFDYSFPYYEFKFEPVWQGDVEFRLQTPADTGLVTPALPGSIEGLDVGTEITLPKAVVLDGYKFNGWKPNLPENAQSYEPESAYTITFGKVTFTGNWTAIVYTINWNSNGGQETLAPAEAEYRSTIENFPTPHKEGYTFIGWKSNVEGDDTLYNKENSFTMPSHDVTMTAQWKINTYNVSYDGNGTTIGVYKESDAVEYGNNYTIQQASGITPTRFGYKFLGWKINGEGNLLQAGDSFTMPAEDVTLVAQWESTSSKSYQMKKGVGYTHDGAFRIKGDPNNYQDKITFYVPDDGEFTFE